MFYQEVPYEEVALRCKRSDDVSGCCWLWQLSRRRWSEARSSGCSFSVRQSHQPDTDDFSQPIRGIHPITSEKLCQASAKTRAFMPGFFMPETFPIPLPGSRRSFTLVLSPSQHASRCERPCPGSPNLWPRSEWAQSHPTSSSPGSCFGKLLKQERNLPLRWGGGDFSRT